MITHRSDVLPRNLLAQGFEYEGQRIHLIGPQGIFTPQQLKLPISITTVPNGPYSDIPAPDKEGNWLYKYRGKDEKDIGHRDNVGLRKLMIQKVPLIYFIGLRPGRYLTVFPVFIVEDDPRTMTFRVMADDNAAVTIDSYRDTDIDNARRRYVTAAVRVRLHQRDFREKVIAAYKEQCACCRLRHLELLDAAHIVADAQEGGEPVVNNGISLCKLHHAAFDSNILGIRPDYVIEINKDVLLEKDGPLLRHGLQDLHHSKLVLPRNQGLYPDPKRLEARYVEFMNN